MSTELDIDGKDLIMLRNLYLHQTSAVINDNELIEFKPIRRGLLSPDLFNLFSKIIIRRREDKRSIVLETQTTRHLLQNQKRRSNKLCIL